MKHKTHGKAVTGPGGIRCACCTKGRPSYTKTLSARQDRRENKKEIRLALSGK